MIPRAQVRLVAFAATGLVAACVRTPAVRYYTIPDLRGAPPPARSQPEGYSVRVAAVVPDELDRPELVLKLSPTEVLIDDGHRWAEPLPTALARAVTANLARDLAGARVQLADEAREAADVEVALRVRHLDLELGRQVDLEVIWEIRSADRRSRTGGSVAHAPVAGPGYDALAVACARALATVSDDLSGALPK